MANALALIPIILLLIADSGLVEAFRVKGLAEPESFLADSAGDGFFISNVNGKPGEPDGNGFITRLKDDGTVEALKWAPPGPHGMPALDAPKGLAIWLPDREDQRAPVTRWLVIADLTRLVVVDLTGTEPPSIVDLAPAGGRFLNDVAVASDGTVYATDTAARCVWKVLPDYTARRRNAPPEPLLDLGEHAPNGLLLRGKNLAIVTWGLGKLLEASREGKPKATMAAFAADPAPENLDGLAEFDGDLWFSSWAPGAVYRLRDGRAEPVLTGLTTPADISIDAKRRLLLVPFMESGEAAAYRIPE